MNSRYFHYLILPCILASLPFHQVTAKDGDSFLEALLRFTGIALTPSQTRGNNNFMNGNIWLVLIEDGQASESRKMTHSGTYRSPLWMPESQLIIAMKGNKLVRLDTQGKEETLHTLTNNTALIGFDKNNPDLVLIHQDPTSVGILSLMNGKITRLHYDDKNPKQREGLDRLRSGSRVYASSEVFIEDKKEPLSQGGFKSFNAIHIIQGNKTLPPILCPGTCNQPALTEDGRQLLFISD